jgi:hypothetical protein
VLALVGGLALIAAFFMPWFASQGLLLSGQFLNDFLGSATVSDLQRFMPGTSTSQAQLLHGLVLLFPACGALAAGTCLLLSLTSCRIGMPLAVLLFATGFVPLAAWLIGITRLPAGATLQIGLWLIAGAAVAVVIGAVLEIAARRPAQAVL